MVKMVVFTVALTREEMLERGMPQAKANAATAAELVRWLWALGTMCREAGE